MAGMMVDQDTMIMVEVRDSSGQVQTCSVPYNLMKDCTCNGEGLSFSFEVIDSCGQVAFMASDTTLTGLSWDFGDGDDSTAINEVAPVHQYLMGGTYTVCMAVADSTCMDTICQDIMVMPDTIAPVFVQCPTEIRLQATMCQDSLVVAYTIGAEDNCDPDVDIVSTSPSGSRFPIGTTTVTCTASDDAGNMSTCVFDVIIEEVMPQVAVVCPDSIIISPNDSCVAMVPMITPEMLGLIDNCPPVTISQSIMAGTEISMDTMLTVVVIDSMPADSILMDTCMITLQVLDTVPPTLECLEDILISLPPNVPGTTVEFSDIIVQDNCGATLTCDFNSGDFFPCGTTTVTCTATDDAGNQTMCSFDIIVTCDTSCCVSIDSFNRRVDAGFQVERNGCDVSILPNDLDQCHVLQYRWGDGDSTMMVSGADTIRHTYAEDGNYEICITVEEFSVLDTIPGACWSRDTCFSICVSCDTITELNITCPEDVIAMAPIGSDSIAVSFPDPMIRNTCDRIWFCDYQSGDLFPLDTTLVTCTVVDTIANDTLTCSFNVIVLQDSVGMNPCDSLSAQLSAGMSMGDTCCYNLSLINNTVGMNLSGLGIQVNESNQIFSLTVLDTNWMASQDSITGAYGLIPVGGAVPQGNLGEVARICVDGRLVTPNELFVSWVSVADSSLMVVCSDTLQLDCQADACAMSPIQLTVEKIQDEDCGLSNGSARAVVSGGTAPFLFSWSTGADSMVVDSLPFGTHFVRVTDANGCFAVGEVSIGFTDLFLISGSQVRNDECDHPGSIAIDLMGGVAPFAYSWTNGDTTAALTDLEAGVFGVTITDANGCQTSSEYEVTSGPDSILVNLVATNDFCELEAIPQNGLAPFDIFWSNLTSGSVSGELVIGEEYTLFINDVDGCASTVRFTAEIGVANAAFTFVSEGLTAQFEGGGETAGHFWDFGNGFASTLRSPEFVYTEAGTYTVTHITENTCGRDTAMAEVTVEDPVSNINLDMVREMSLYPNPTMETLHVQIETDGRWKGDLVIFNLLGQRVFEAIDETIDQSYTRKIDVSSFVPSTYMLALRIDEQTVFRKFIVQR